MPTYHKPLNTLQKELLATLYKFRFATAQLIASRKGNSPRVINTRLKVLLDQEYIGRNYDSSYRIRGKQASYYLLPKGIRYLSKQDFSHPKVINSMYRDKQASGKFIEHQLSVFRIYVEFKRLHNKDFNIFGKSELAKYDYFPETPPDLFLNRTKPSKTKPKYFFLDYYDEATLFYQNIAKIRQYIEYTYEEIWKDKTKTDMPTVLIVCETRQLQRRLARRIKREMENSFADINFWLTTKEALITATEPDSYWQVIDDDELYNN